ncbi:hypothetical protein BJ508DRAFT_411734 [Ascobolus immersus RN42]|uniref:F-box domain-containing protein n=1 Tax=Ascobolus immersus RN42 TaxID=1160509 RepID=A0A3N4INM6_ASCIM|nr:hypothetical protein BJ508DRAFT_411734 [Ascobolus immersus RN42]
MTTTTSAVILLTQYPVLCSIAHHLDHTDLYHLSQTCRTLHGFMNSSRQALQNRSLECQRQNIPPGTGIFIIWPGIREYRKRGKTACPKRLEGKSCSRRLVKECCSCGDATCYKCNRAKQVDLPRRLQQFKAAYFNPISRLRPLCEPCCRQTTSLAHEELCACDHEEASNWLCNRCYEARKNRDTQFHEIRGNAFGASPDPLTGNFAGFRSYDYLLDTGDRWSFVCPLAEVGGNCVGTCDPGLVEEWRAAALERLSKVTLEHVRKTQGDPRKVEWVIKWAGTGSMFGTRLKKVEVGEPDAYHGYVFAEPLRERPFSHMVLRGKNDMVMEDAITKGGVVRGYLTKIEGRAFCAWCNKLTLLGEEEAEAWEVYAAHHSYN